MKVSDILRSKGPDVATVQGSDPLSVAVHAFLERGVRSLVVTENGKHVAGVLSVRDVLRRLDEGGGACLDEPVAQAMTAAYAAVQPEVSVSDAERIFIEKRIHHLPVIDDDELVGVVTPADVLGGHLRDVEMLNDNLIRYVYGGI